MFTNCNNLINITIPESVTCIGEESFYGCTNLNAIIIPDSVKTIEYGAFFCCYHLYYIYYTGTVSEWSDINIDPHNDLQNQAVIIYYHTGEIPYHTSFEIDTSENSEESSNTEISDISDDRSEVELSENSIDISEKDISVISVNESTPAKRTDWYNMVLSASAILIILFSFTIIIIRRHRKRAGEK